MRLVKRQLAEARHDLIFQVRAQFAHPGLLDPSVAVYHQKSWRAGYFHGVQGALQNLRHFHTKFLEIRTAVRNRLRQNRDHLNTAAQSGRHQPLVKSGAFNAEAALVLRARIRFFPDFDQSTPCRETLSPTVGWCSAGCDGSRNLLTARAATNKMAHNMAMLVAISRRLAHPLTAVHHR
jgi:hypothetical protein